MVAWRAAWFLERWPEEIAAEVDLRWSAFHRLSSPAEVGTRLELSHRN